MKVTVLGGTGRMGRWFSRYFLSMRHSVIVSDIKRNSRIIAKRDGIVFIKSNIEAVKDSDLVIICVPIDQIKKVIDEICTHLKKGCIVMEISSIKSKIMKSLRRLTSQGIIPISLHPLFGPGAKTINDKTIALIPIKDENDEIKIAKTIFPTAILRSVAAEDHDKIMGLTLSLPHFMNLVFASVLTNENLFKIKRFAGTSFMLQFFLAGSVLSEEAEIYASIQTANKYSISYLNKFMNQGKILTNIVRNKNEKQFIKLFNRIKKSLESDLSATKPYEKLYSLME